MSDRDGGGGRAVVRHARAEDLGRVVELVAEHAEYEKAAPPPPGLATRLAGLLFGGEGPGGGARGRTGSDDGSDGQAGPDDESHGQAGPGGGSPRLRCFVAELPDGSLAGYATCAPELSTWDGVAYLHMDCLYLTSTARGHGLGPLLMDAVRAEARALGLTEIQWQTPAWNEGAIRFYDRLGATSKEKRRYTLAVDPAASASVDGE
ncbi:acetyltransferase [Streptomyces sp. Root431]|uniref:GNAT family N-acetyltransferase n=1 Tax=Streptomyces sp. Root431 TaxID=1736535 RepID=UPI0006FDA41A|nr:GNAT family N-acetyltransferase [Streptomyces sp. Root431]KQX13913.1 acetyltransferase [Streptomyces sp. Root431]